MWFDEHGIHWIRNRISFPYVFEGQARRYTPDFYLPVPDCFIEVKGWKVAKDEAKWSQFPARLMILSGHELTRIGVEIGPFREWPSIPG
jgi:hypothetical protein